MTELNFETPEAEKQKLGERLGVFLRLIFFESEKLMDYILYQFVIKY